MKTPKYLLPIACYFVAILIISTIASTKLTSFRGFTFDAGTILFPFAYILGDVITEVYGYKNARRVIWSGIGVSVLMAVVFWVVGLLPPSPDWVYQQDYQNILGVTMRIVLASVIAFLVGEFSNAYVLATMKLKQKGKRFWRRAFCSTLVGQGLDTVVFVLVAFWGVFPPSVVLAIIISNYIFKVAVELLILPVTTKVVSRLKKNEGGDEIYDKKTDFNPFQLS